MQKSCRTCKWSRGIANFTPYEREKLTCMCPYLIEDILTPDSEINVFTDSVNEFYCNYWE